MPYSKMALTAKLIGPAVLQIDGKRAYLYAVGDVNINGGKEGVNEAELNSLLLHYSRTQSISANVVTPSFLLGDFLFLQKPNVDSITSDEILCISVLDSALHLAAVSNDRLSLLQRLSIYS